MIMVPLPGRELCVEARFIRRVKRFSVLCELNGKEIWAHTNNTGAMLGLLRPCTPVLLSPPAHPGRKLPWTLERICLENDIWVGVNTSVPNRMLAAAFAGGCLPNCVGYEVLRRERKYGQSRFDACISGAGRPDLWVECKNVTLVEDNVAAFPDAQSQRARKHLAELVAIAQSGQRAAMFFLIQRPDGKCFAPAAYIDQEYADMFYEAMQAGVQMWPFRGHCVADGIVLGEMLPIADKSW